MITLKVNTPKSYVICIEEGIAKTIPEGFIITDTNIAKNYPQLIKNNVFVIQAGEESKNLDTYKQIAEKLSNSDAKTIIALGGGVVGDIAGFVAGTYKRGIDLIQIPTSLLAMVDSSIGGKNGINLGNKKNYLGTFYQPKSVLIDPIFLKTLPLSEKKNGLAEIIKYHSILGKPSLSSIKESILNQNFNEIIVECCKLKAEVVEKDELDLGYRHVLNFGHTIGHAIELLAGLSHGEAISIGMAKEAELGRSLGYISKEKCEEIISLLKQAELPVSIPQNLDINKIIELMKQDKKGSLFFSFNPQNYDIQLNEDALRQFLK